jgi:hypothetical protein
MSATTDEPLKAVTTIYDQEQEEITLRGDAVLDEVGMK